MNCCHTLATILLLVDAYYNTKLTSNEMTYSSDTNLPIFILLFFSGNTVQRHIFFFFFFNDTPPTEIYPLPLHDALPIYLLAHARLRGVQLLRRRRDVEPVLGDGGEITQLVHLHCPPSLTQPAPSCYRSITAAQPLRSNHSFCAARGHRYSPRHHGKPGGARAGTQGGGRAHAAHRRPGTARAAGVLEQPGGRGHGAHRHHLVLPAADRGLQHRYRAPVRGDLRAPREIAAPLPAHRPGRLPGRRGARAAGGAAGCERLLSQPRGAPRMLPHS